MTIRTDERIRRGYQARPAEGQVKAIPFTKGNAGRFDCYANAEPNEPMFILLARDFWAPVLVRGWATFRENAGEDAEKVANARACADAMEQWRAEHRKPVAIPDTPAQEKRDYAYLTCFAPNCGAMATHGKYCATHKDFERILREQVVILEEIGAGAETITIARQVLADQVEGADPPAPSEQEWKDCGCGMGCDCMRASEVAAILDAVVSTPAFGDLAPVEAPAQAPSCEACEQGFCDPLYHTEGKPASAVPRDEVMGKIVQAALAYIEAAEAYRIPSEIWNHIADKKAVAITVRFLETRDALRGALALLHSAAGKDTR